MDNPETAETRSAGTGATGRPRRFPSLLARARPAFTSSHRQCLASSSRAAEGLNRAGALSEFAHPMRPFPRSICHACSSTPSNTERLSAARPLLSSWSMPTILWTLSKHGAQLTCTVDPRDDGVYAYLTVNAWRCLSRRRACLACGQAVPGRRRNGFCSDGCRLRHQAARRAELLERLLPDDPGRPEWGAQDGGNNLRDSPRDYQRRSPRPHCLRWRGGVSLGGGAVSTLEPPGNESNQCQ